MLKHTYISIKKVWTFAFVPRILRGHNIKYSPGRFEKSMPISAAKSTLADSDDPEGGGSEKCLDKDIHAKRQRIINYVFGIGEYPASDLTGFQGLQICDDKPTKQPDYPMVLSTTRKETTQNQDDKLVQKIEKIEETPLVEAETPDTCPPDTNPQVLGKAIAERHMTVRSSRHSRSKFSRTPYNSTTENPALQYLKKRKDLFDKTWQSLNSISKHKTAAFYPKDNILKDHVHFSSNDSDNKPGVAPDCEWAKRLDQKSNQIDERFLEEMEKLGVPSTGTKSHNTLQGEIVQADIMTKSKKTADKPEMDLESRQLDEVDRKRLYKKQADKQDDSKQTLMPNQRNTKSPLDKESSDVVVPRTTVESNTTTLREDLAGSNVNSQSKPLGGIPGGTPTLAGHLALIDPYDKKTLARNTCLVSSAETARITEVVTTPISAQESSRSDSPVTVQESTEDTSATENTFNGNTALMTSHLKEQTLFNVQLRVQESPKENHIIYQGDMLELEKDKPDIQIKPTPVEQRQENEESLNPGELKAETILPPALQLKFITAYETEMAPQTFKPDFINLQMTEPEIYTFNTTEYQKLRLRMISPDFNSSPFTPEQLKTVESVSVEPITEDIDKAKEELLKHYLPPAYEKIDCLTDKERAQEQPKTVDQVSVERTTEDIDKTKEIIKQTKDLLEYYLPPAYEKIKCNISSSVGPLPLVAPKDDKNIPLSELLARVRMRSRMEISKTMDSAQIEPEAKKCPPPPPCCPPPPPCCPKPPPCCPKPPPCCPPPPPCPKPPPCPPPPPPCCPKPPPCCPPPRPPCPKPPSCPPPPRCPPPCPCPPKCTPPCCTGPCTPKKSDSTRKSIRVPDTLTMILSTSGYPKTLSPWMMLPQHSMEFNIEEPVETERVEEVSSDHMVMAREFEPWTPIPCWPHPKRIEKKKLVCPKDGCRVQPPPKDGDFCKPTEKPCTHFPKRLTFLSEELLPEHVPKKFIDLGHF